MHTSSVAGILSHLLVVGMEPLTEAVVGVVGRETMRRSDLGELDLHQTASRALEATQDDKRQSGGCLAFYSPDFHHLDALRRVTVSIR